MQIVWEESGYLLLSQQDTHTLSESGWSDGCWGNDSDSAGHGAQRSGLETPSSVEQTRGAGPGLLGHLDPSIVEECAALQGAMANLQSCWFSVKGRMAHCTLAGTEHQLTYFNLMDEDEGDLGLPPLESTRLEEEYICLPSHGGKAKEVEEEEMDEEQQVLYEGSFVFGM